MQFLQQTDDTALFKGAYVTVPPGDYKFRCALDLPGFSGNGADGKQHTPADGEWTGSLKSAEVDVKLLPTEPGNNPALTLENTNRPIQSRQWNDRFAAVAYSNSLSS